ncbi:hypothetical protein [Photobacterium damselae]|uniref:hypothetical protein n=1 Tax=Photobacterium damselae TaxID=38293 RepID=UPI001F19E699|nr:hypothetical protein [Photobacterium damselae]UKA04728.1 hypothetical protein IHC89_21035 [Photobacterium damselae subsp. damselae]
MKKNNSKVWILSALSAAAVSSTAFAGWCPADMIDYFAPPAATQITAPINTAFTAYDLAVSQGASIGMANIQSAATDANLSTMKTILQTAQDETRNKYQIAATSQDLKMGMAKRISDIEAKEKASLVVGGGSGFYQGIIKSSQLSTVSSVGDANQAKILNARLGKALEDITVTTGTNVGRRMADIRDHYNKYCDVSGKNAGYCSGVAKIPNADILSFVFLNPLNDEAKRYVKQFKYITKYTYSPYEAEAAFAYIKHAVPMDNLPKISLSTQANKLDSVKVARFKQLSSALNIARYNYLLAYQNRLPLKTGISKMDKIGMMVDYARNGGLNAARQGTDKGAKVYLLNQMNVNRYLSSQLEQYEQRNNDLLATYLSLRESSPQMVKSMS